tara:strand:- start:1601 stop:2983 length:1383 start_codon:yes stop_codon:yes gene_type:complete
MSPRVVIVGAGITGLAAAHRIITDHPKTKLVVLEAASKAGGRLVTTPLLDLPIDEGADAFLIRVPWALELFREIGVEEELVSPKARNASIWLDNSLKPLPVPNFLGIPLNPEEITSDLLTQSELKKLTANSSVTNKLPKNLSIDDDLSVGQVVRSCIGDGVLERLVDPLLGGINAGQADNLSCAVMAPQLLYAARHPDGLLPVLQKIHQETVPTDPIFNAHPRGMSYLIDQLVKNLDSSLRLDWPVQSLTAKNQRWELHSENGTELADVVILTTPAAVTAKLLSEISPSVASTLAAISHASVSIATFVYKQSDTPLPKDQSGFLIPRNSGMMMTACSYSSNKWDHLNNGDYSVLRVSTGRIDDNRQAELDDSSLMSALQNDLATTTGIRTQPSATRLTRWPKALPQFLPGHQTQMTEISRQLKEEAAGITLAGNHRNGVGIPACIKSSNEAISTIVDRLD